MPLRCPTDALRKCPPMPSRCPVLKPHTQLKFASTKHVDVTTVSGSLQLHTAWACVCVLHGCQTIAISKNWKRPGQAFSRYTYGVCVNKNKHKCATLLHWARPLAAPPLPCTSCFQACSAHACYPSDYLPVCLTVRVSV